MRRGENLLNYKKIIALILFYKTRRFMKRIVSIIMIMVFGCMLFLAACSKRAPFDMSFYILLSE